ncbi:short-chain dehydrogenase/reductase-like protein [Xylariaceae sp. FL0255]|nr:short-chain dehydrogenase/reductase-like protein [Xylariaceae sp. FL0255]
MSKPWILVSPSSRGIGHVLAAHLLRSTALPILATARSDLAGVKDSIVNHATLISSSSPLTRADLAARLHVTQLDVTDESSIEAAASQAADLFPSSSHHLHLAFNLPGILYPEKSPRQVDYEDALETFKVNTLGPLILMKWFGGFLPRKGTDMSLVKRERESTSTSTSSSNGGGEQGRASFRLPAQSTWLTTSARVGSTTDNRLGGWYSYRASKAGVISLTKSFDLYLRSRSAQNAIAIAYHPGTVKTGLSQEFWDKVAPEKLFSAEFAVEKMLGVVSACGEGDRGRCWDWKGEEVPP